MGKTPFNLLNLLSTFFAAVAAGVACYSVYNTQKIVKEIDRPYFADKEVSNNFNSEKQSNRVKIVLENVGKRAARKLRTRLFFIDTSTNRTNQRQELISSSLNDEFPGGQLEYYYDFKFNAESPEIKFLIMAIKYDDSFFEEEYYQIFYWRWDMETWEKGLNRWAMARLSNKELIYSYIGQDIKKFISRDDHVK